MEISPQEIISDYIPPQYTPCGPYILQTDYYNPYQVIWNGGWFYIDPFQQLFNYQRNYYTYSLDPGHYYNVTITTGAEYCYIVKSGYWDPDEDEFYYPEIIGDELLNVQGIKLIGTGDWVPAICSRWEKENPPGYYILFERDVPEGSEVIITIDDLTVGNSINYHTRIEIPLMELENRTDLDTLYHFYARFINVEAKRSEIHSQCWACWGQFPSSVRFTIEVVQGQEYGSLYDTETDEFALSFTNIETEWGSGFIFNYEDGERFKYVADGIQPDSSEPGLVTIRITPSDGNLNTIEFSFFVAYNEDPPEEGVIVIFAEQQIAPGDTTQIILKRRSSDGTLEDFSEWDSFEIGMLEGCDAGKILVGGVLAPYFEEVNQPIYFVAASDLTETDTVKVRVGLIESSASRPMQTNKEREIITLRKNTTTQQKPFGENTATYCFPGEIVWPKMGDGFVVVGDECDEEIVVCDNYDPQIFPEHIVEIVKENDPWQWLDYLGDPQSTNTGTACKEGARSGCETIRFGVTYVMQEIGKYSNTGKKYVLAEDIKIKPCLDKSDPVDEKWFFDIENIRVPIFSAICSEQPNNCGWKIDLLDGKNHDTLEKYITNYETYKEVLKAIDWWAIGPYTNNSNNNYYSKLNITKYYFSQGIIAHEQKHVLQADSCLNVYMNSDNGMKIFRRPPYILSRQNYSCPEDVINVLKKGLRTSFKGLIIYGTNIDNFYNVKNGIPKYEMDADSYAKTTYNSIKYNIESWAQNQLWFPK